MARILIQSDTQESALELIRSAITSEVYRLELGLRATERHIRGFEEQYRITSDVFLRDFAAEDLVGGDQEYVAWAGEIRLRDRIASALETLQGIQYAA